MHGRGKYPSGLFSLRSLGVVNFIRLMMACDALPRFVDTNSRLGVDYTCHLWNSCNPRHFAIGPPIQYKSRFRGKEGLTCFETCERSRRRLTVAAGLLLIGTFSSARADQIGPSKVAALADSATKEQALGAPQSFMQTLPESFNGEQGNSGVVFSYAQSRTTSVKSADTLSIEALREDAGRMHMPGFADAVPEPTTIVLLATGALGLGVVIRRRV